MIKNYGNKGGLRRVNPTTLSYCTESECEEHLEVAKHLEEQQQSDDKCNGEGARELLHIFAIPPSQNWTGTDEQMQQLVAICETVHRQVRAVLQKLGQAVDAVNATNSDFPRNACELLRTYEFTIWPCVVEVDLNIKSLSQFVRETIDSCSINEPRLESLLNVSKFQVTMENSIGNSIDICTEIECILRVRARGEVRGLRIKKETIAEVKTIQNKVDNNWHFHSK